MGHKHTVQVNGHAIKLLLCFPCILNIPEYTPRQAVTIYQGEAICEVCLKQKFRERNLGALIKLESNPSVP